MAVGARMEYRIPARGLIGFANEFMNLTRGSGLISNIFDSYEPHKGAIGGRKTACSSPWTMAKFYLCAGQTR